MFRTKESVKFAYLIFSCMILQIAVLAVCKVKWPIILLSALIYVVIYVISVLILKKMHDDIGKLRESISDSNRTEHITELPLMFEEGELSKLADELSNVLGELNEAEEKQRREKEFLRDIISDISHQIKTPVASLTVFNDIFIKELNIEKEVMLANGKDGEAVEAEFRKKEEMLSLSAAQLDRIKWLVQSMLMLARIEAESVIFVKERTDISQLVNEAIGIVKIKAEEKNVRFVVEANEAFAETDKEWLKEAVINILKNAIDYGPDGMDIKVSIEGTPIATKISVEDKGIGIKEQDFVNIFKRFYRVDNEVNPNSVGIGLALSKSIVEGLGGRIWVESRHRDECKGDEKSFTRMNILL